MSQGDQAVEAVTFEAQANLFQQNTEIEILDFLMPFLGEKTFLDIGAESGEITRFFSSHGLKGMFFEPLPQCEAKLTELAEKTGSIFSSYAIDSTDRTADFYHAFDKTNNDAQHFSSLHPLQDDTRITHKKVKTVQCRSLNSLLNEGVLSQHIGVIKVDTEGNDLNVLKGMDKITTEILMCEYFMPKIYAGWELGHPLGLIQEAKNLGFNHFLAIKRVGDFESITLDNDAFTDKQWGNLIFISDKVYNDAKSVLTSYLASKKESFINSALINAAKMQEICDERLKVINELSNGVEVLRNICDERQKVIELLNAKLINKITLFTYKAFKKLFGKKEQ